MKELLQLARRQPSIFLNSSVQRRPGVSGVWTWMNCYDSDKCNIRVGMPALAEFMEGWGFFLKVKERLFFLMKCRM